MNFLGCKIGELITSNIYFSGKLFDAIPLREKKKTCREY